MSKPKIFLNIGTYLPGYRGGGPTQSVKNLVSALSDEFEFYIFTANHDLGIKEPYQNVDTDKWNEYEGVNIFYSSDQNKRKNLINILEEKKFSLMFLNSFFSTDTINILLIRKKIKMETPLILMPRGELSEGALNIKKMKKRVYIKIANLINFYKDINFLTTAEDEYEQVQNILGTTNVYKVSNIPNTEKNLVLNTKEDKKLKVVFLSRITQKKNLDYALETLMNCRSNIEFDIYGTLEEIGYWEKCKEIIETLPINIHVSYKGELNNRKVINTLSNYDLFYFPTKSENYGHVISEALQASIPILISDQTPWKNLAEKKYGWEFELKEKNEFSKKIDELSKINKNQYNEIKNNIFDRFDPESNSKPIISTYKNLLNQISK